MVTDLYSHANVYLDSWVKHKQNLARIPQHVTTIITPSMLFWSHFDRSHRGNSQTHALFDIISILSNPILIHYETLISAGGSEGRWGSLYRAWGEADYLLCCSGVQMKEKQNDPSHSNVVLNLTPYQLEVIIRESSLYFL